MQQLLRRSLCDFETFRYLAFEVKQYHRPDCNAFDVFGRVLSGTVFRGDRVKILGLQAAWMLSVLELIFRVCYEEQSPGETYSLDDDEDMAIKEIQNLWILEASLAF